MIPEQCVKVRWNSRTKNYYLDKGYIYTGNNNLFWADVRDIKSGSDVFITVICDYCNSYVIRTMKDQTKFLKNSLTKKDCCSSIVCLPLKRKEEHILKYGVENPMHRDEVKTKTKETLLRRYGVKKFGHIEGNREKIIKTSLDKYGFENPLQSEDVINKRRATNLIRYGHINAAQSFEIRKKIVKTYESRGTVRTSTQQVAVYEMLLSAGYDVKLNYPVSATSLDIGLFIEDKKINIEYDGWYWHQDTNKDRRRDEYIKSQGWSILRIRSGKLTPKLDSIINSINKILKEDKKYEQLILEDWRQNNLLSSNEKNYKKTMEE